MAVIEIVDTKILKACNMAIILHSIAHVPKGQYFESISINVNGIVTRHKSKSMNRKKKN